MDGSGWEWVGVGGSGWEWVGVGGSGWEHCLVMSDHFKLSELSATRSAKSDHSLPLKKL